MTKAERKEVEDKLMAVASTIVNRKQGDQRDIATVGSISALVYAISTGQEQEFAGLVLSRFAKPPKTGRPPKPRDEQTLKASKKKGSKK
jgi:hypothetical protein